jgi:hypothetical protein
MPEPPSLQGQGMPPGSFAHLRMPLPWLCGWDQTEQLPAS